MLRRVPAAAVLAGLLLGPARARADEDGLDGPRAGLRSGDKWTRAEAVEELARAGTRAAWELVVGALADPRGEVADTAQVALSGLRGADELELLDGEGGLRAKEALVRARAVEILGRLAEAPPARWLERALRDRDAEVRRMAAWSVERLAREGRFEAESREDLAAHLERGARSERDPLGRCRFLASLGVLAPARATKHVIAACGERESLLRGAGAALVGEVLAPGEALGHLARLARDEEPAVRRVSVEALARLGTPGAVTVLVERLSEEGEERLLLRLVDRLQRLSGLKHRRDPRPWRDWAAGLPDDWRAPMDAQEAEREGGGEREGRTRTTLAGLPIVSRRVAVLIDLSGSIWNVRPDGRTRKQVVDQKLREALESLPEDTRFNLIPYTSEPIPWRDGLVDATPRRVREAATWFEARRENGSGNFWDAAVLALEDPEVDTLVVLFDGAPTGGTRHRLELITPLFLERNFARGVTLDLVLVDASKRLRRLWGELARATGGLVVPVSL